MIGKFYNHLANLLRNNELAIISDITEDKVKDIVVKLEEIFEVTYN